MLNWATSQLKELGVPLDTLTSVVDNITNQMAEVCAPIGSPSSPLVMSITRKDTNETLRMLQSGDINTSMDCILNSSVGSRPIHLACQHDLRPVIDYILQMDPNQSQQFDYGGNTPLHYAAKFGQLDVCKLLIVQFSVSASLKNARGETPYDGSNNNYVRQYLLPLQLQSETKDMQNSGTLPGGITVDSITQGEAAYLPPPPIGGGVGGGGGGGYNNNGTGNGNGNNNSYVPQRTIKPDGFESSQSQSHLKAKYGNTGEQNFANQQPVMQGQQQPIMQQQQPTMQQQQQSYNHGGVMSNLVAPGQRQQLASRYVGYDAVNDSVQTFAQVQPPVTQPQQPVQQPFVPPPVFQQKPAPIQQPQQPAVSTPMPTPTPQQTPAPTIPTIPTIPTTTQTTTQTPNCKRLPPPPFYNATPAPAPAAAATFNQVPPAPIDSPVVTSNTELFTMGPNSSSMM